MVESQSKAFFQGLRVESDAISMPAAAIGVLHFMGITFSDLEFYRSTACIAATPIFLKLLHEIAAKHPSMVCT